MKIMDEDKNILQNRTEENRSNNFQFPISDDSQFSIFNSQFSIITVTYNAESVVERTILSVLEQTYPNIEYIIIDGQSTDNTMLTLAKYAERISVTVSERDGGIYDAMNKGLRLATGDYLWFLNAGDTIYSADTVAEIVKRLDAEIFPDIIYGETAIVDHDGKFLYPRRLKAPEKLDWHSFKNGMMVCHQSFIVKRKIAPEYDLRFRYSADYDWCIRCMKLAGCIHNSKTVLTNYLNEGMTTKNMKQSLKERFTIMCRYYGKIMTCLRHTVFVLRFVCAKIRGKN